MSSVEDTEANAAATEEEKDLGDLEEGEPESVDAEDFFEDVTAD